MARVGAAGCSISTERVYLERRLSNLLRMLIYSLTLHYNLYCAAINST
jgi:hypothetical protein